MQKPTVTVGGVALDASAGFTWQLVQGVQPYTVNISVPVQQSGRIEEQIGEDVTIVIVTSQGQRIEINRVTILHRLPSATPGRRAYALADGRWRWRFPGVFRDYNITRKTGDRTIADRSVPIETATVVDSYDYLPYSLNAGALWQPQEVVEDILATIEEATGTPFRVDGFPLGVDAGVPIQDLELRDSADVALSRMLERVPGTGVFIDLDGTAVIYDAADIEAQRRHFVGLPSSTYNGERAEYVQRRAIRPSMVRVHFQREVEVRLTYEDSLDNVTTTGLDRTRPYLENVIQTVDPETEVQEYDPEADGLVTKVVPAGTWVTFEAFLEYCRQNDGGAPLPWNWETIREFWHNEGVMATQLGSDEDVDNLQQGTNAARVAAIRRHFRQSFRVNRRYMERNRSLRAVRVAVLDPVTGARAPAPVWGQVAIIPSSKGITRGLNNDQGIYTNVDFLAESNDSGVNLVNTAPGPATISILDEELGVFRVDYLTDPGGLRSGFFPSHVVQQGQGNTPKVPRRNLALQDTDPIADNVSSSTGSNALWLRSTMKMQCILTMVPAAPNNARQFHVIEVAGGQVQARYQREFRIASGTAPAMDVFVPPGEATARFAWEDDEECTSTVSRLFALDSDDPNTAGVEGNVLPGFVFANGERVLPDYAQSIAGEILAPLADSVQGSIVHAVPAEGPRLVGNMASTEIRVASAPSTIVEVVSVFPPGQRPLTRLALLEPATRRALFGAIPFRS